MAKKSFSSVRIQTKRDTAANWEKNNPVLLNGEKIIVDTAAGEIREKIGDGVKKYSALPFTDEPLRTLIGNKVDKASGKGLSTNDYTTDEKNKLAGIATGANKYTHPTYTSVTNGLYKVTVDGSGHVSSAIAVSKADITGLGIPASNTTYSVATTDNNGLMSSDDKTKLDGIDEGANKYTHPSSHSASMITQDTTHRFVSDAEKSAWNAKASTSVATTTASGLMSSDDKSKLDGIAIGANKYSHPTYTSRTAGLYKVTVDGSGHVSAVTAVGKADITGLGIPGSDTTYSVATTDTDGLMGSKDKTKLDGIDDGANKYTHPSSHGASMITQDETHRFVSDAQISTWNAKASTSVATTTANGLMASTDKTKLDGIDEGANKYTHPSSHAASMITQDATHRFVSDAEKSTWNAKASTSTATASTSGLMSAADKAKLDGIASNATKITVDDAISSTSTNPVQNKVINTLLASKSNTNHTHAYIPTSQKGSSGGVAELDGTGKVPASQLPSFVDDVIDGYLNNGKLYTTRSGSSGNYTYSGEITGESGKIYIDLNTEKTYRWSGNSYVVISETIAIGETSSTAYRGDRGKIAYDHSQTAHAPSNANYYAHPTYTKHDAGLYKVTVDSTGHVSTATAVTKADITGLGIPASNTTYSLATTSANGLMASTDKTKLDGIDEGANKYTHPSSHGASMITQDATHRFVSDTQISTWNAKASTSVATTTASGLMSSDDKSKLDGIDDGANKYTHPTYTSHTAGLYKVTVDGNGHVSAVAAVTKADITGLGIPASNTTYSVATTTVNGLMSSDDKSKLDGIDDGANKYTHPSSHAASMITTDATHRFVSDTQISTWNAKASTSVATTSANGLMSSDDKTKLDGIASGANKYSHPTYTSRAAGLYKVTVDGSGHVSAATAVAKADITSLGIPGSDTNTTYDLAASASSTNGNVKLNLTAGGSGSGTDTISIKGSGATTVTTDADGAITISSTDNNTTYSLATTTANGLMAAADKVAVNKISSLETRITNIEEKLKTAVFYK